MQTDFFSQLNDDSLRYLLQKTTLNSALLILVGSSLHVENLNEQAAKVLELRSMERIDQILSESAVQTLRDCIADKCTRSILEELDGISYTVEIVPQRDGVLLVFLSEDSSSYSGSLRIMHQKISQYTINVLSSLSQIEDKTIAEQLRKQCLRMQRLLNHSDFLHENWQAEHFHFQSVNLAELCHEIAENASKRSGYHITAETPNEYRMTLHKDLITQAIYNLVTNAIQASPKDQEITIVLRPDPISPSVTVIDRGPGFKPELFHLLLNSWKTPFPLEERLELSTHRVSIGLGLPLTQRIAQIHGGQLFFAQRQGGGSKFHLVLSHLPIIFQNPSLGSSIMITEGSSYADLELSVL